MKFNIEDDDDDMHMVENSSIHSEDIDLDMRRQRPPCNFIAPPPPTEPPPDDSEPVDMSMVVSQVDTIDIGVGEGTTSPGPDSNKSSPRSSSMYHFLSYLFKFEKIKLLNTCTLTLKAPITPAADNKFSDIFPYFCK